MTCTNEGFSMMTAAKHFDLVIVDEREPADPVRIDAVHHRMSPA